MRNEWFYQSYIIMLSGRCLAAEPLVSQGIFGRLCDSGCVLAVEVESGDGGCRVVMLSACTLPHPLSTRPVL